MFEAATLIQCRKIGPFPLILIGTAFWHNLIELMDDMLREGAISAEDTGFGFVTDSPAQAVEMILSSQPPGGHRTLVCFAGFGRREGQMTKPIETNQHQYRRRRCARTQRSHLRRRTRRGKSGLASVRNP